MLADSHIQLYRLAHRLYKDDRHGIANFINGINRRLNGIEIHPAAEIGANLSIIHPVGIVIGGLSRIGNNVQINQGVSLGYRRGPIPGDGHPTVEDDVIISAGAKLLGPITIGCGSVVGANAVVLESVPSHSLAIGVPARIIPKKFSGEPQTWAKGDEGL